MKIAIEHVFEGISCEEFEALYFDEPFNIALGDVLDLGRALLKLDRTPDRIVRHIQCEPKQDPNTPQGKAFGTSRASFVEEIDYDLRAHRGSWQTIPNLLPDRVRNAGTLEVVPHARGVQRIVRGEVTVRLFGFGGRVEKIIAAEIEKSYAKSAAFTVAWLARRA